MRALISIYHQAGSFITKDTLDKAIDDAFTPSQLSYRALASMNERNYDELLLEVQQRRQSPKTSDWTFADRQSVASPSIWGESKTDRERAVAEALYGTDDLVKPGLEALEDHKWRIQRSLEEERQHKELSQPDRPQQTP